MFAIRDPRVCVSTITTSGSGLDGMLTTHVQWHVQWHVPAVMGCGECREVQRRCKMCGQRLNDKCESIEPRRRFLNWIGGDMKQVAKDGFLWMTPFGRYV